jgi:hypothetical protein
MRLCFSVIAEFIPPQQDKLCNDNRYRTAFKKFKTVSKKYLQQSKKVFSALRKKMQFCIG